jgi:hypothetical protein
MNVNNTSKRRDVSHLHNTVLELELWAALDLVS